MLWDGDAQEIVKHVFRNLIENIKVLKNSISKKKRDKNEDKDAWIGRKRLTETKISAQKIIKEHEKGWMSQNVAYKT